MKTYIYGAYGTGNLGDDLLLKGALQEYNDNNVIVISYGKPYISKNIKWLHRDHIISNPEKIFEAGDLLIFAGGGLFWSSEHCEDMYLLAKSAVNKNATVKVKRIGAQGMQFNFNAVKNLLSISDFVSVRDLNSVEILKKYKIYEHAVYEEDYALTLSEYAHDVKARQNVLNTQRKKRIGINHSALPFFFDESHRNKAINIYAELSYAYSDSIDFYYIPHTRHFNCIEQNDIVYGEYFWVGSGGRISSYNFPNSIEELIEIYCGLSGCIGWRYHMLVLSKLLNIESSYLGSIEGHKYYSFSLENNIPIFNFDESTNKIIEGISKWIEERVLN